MIYSTQTTPLIFNIFKPARVTSYDVIRHFKRNLPKGYKKIGHFGTLDPFACGVLVLGINGATRLSDFIHANCPKTYLAIGKLGIGTPCGDLTMPPDRIDDSDYLINEIANLPITYLEDFFREKFIGNYLQTPPQYSATKFQGKPLHQWAREGVYIPKEAVLREIYFFEIVRYQFPYFSFRVTVSSGTYIRTLFEDMAKALGTYGSLLSLVREKIGMFNIKNSLHKKDWPLKKKSNLDWPIMQYGITLDKSLELPHLHLSEFDSKLYRNGAVLEESSLGSKIGRKFLLSCVKQSLTAAQLVWVYSFDNQLIGLGELHKEQYRRLVVKFNLPH